MQNNYAKNYCVLVPVEPMHEQISLKSLHFFYYRNTDSIGKNCLLSIVLSYRKKIRYRSSLLGYKFKKTLNTQLNNIFLPIIHLIILYGKLFFYLENNLDYWSDKQFYLAFDFYCQKTLKFQIDFRSKMLITKKYLGQMHLVENFISFQMDYFIFSVFAPKGC